MNLRSWCSPFVEIVAMSLQIDDVYRNISKDEILRSFFHFVFEELPQGIPNKRKLQCSKYLLHIIAYL